MKLPYTICFLQKEDKILLLFRNKAPNQGKWNGVGGKIEEGESPYPSIKREILEETGLRVKNLSFRGIVSWNNAGGMYVYTGTEFEGFLQEGPEGKLAWKTKEWIGESKEVVSNMPYFLPAILGEEPPIEHAFTYSAHGDINQYETKELPHFLIDFAEKENKIEFFSK